MTWPKKYLTYRTSNKGRANKRLVFSTNWNDIAFGPTIKVILYVIILPIHIFLPDCCTRFSCTWIKWYSQLAKIPITLFTHPFPPIEWTNWPINEVHNSKLNWRQMFPCQFIQAYPISIILRRNQTYYLFVCRCWKWPCHIHLSSWSSCTWYYLWSWLQEIS